MLTEADDGTTIHLVTGQKVTVTLGSGGQTWDRPVASGDLLVLISASGGYPTSVPVRAVFQAVRPGTAQLIAMTDAKCLHATPRCAIPQRAWQVTVIISVG